MSTRNYILESPVGPRVRLDGKDYDYFCGTSYYCLHGDPRVIKAACDAARRFGLGPATSWDVPPLREVEEHAARFFQVPRAWYIVSGYLGTFFLAMALRENYDKIFVDERSHYSVFDGIRAAGKRIVSFRHLDPSDLQAKLRHELGAGEVPFVITDGVFPVTGSMAPLPEYLEALAKYERYFLCIDDSHGVGVLGANGRGLCEFYGISGPGVYFTGTTSKAFGGFGGIIPADEDLAEKIARHVKVLLGASPPPVPAAAASAMGIKIVAEHPELRERLRHNVVYLRTKLRTMGIPVAMSPVPIVAIHSLPKVDLGRVQKRLEEEGIMVKYVPPQGYSDVPASGALRIAVFSQHTQDQLDRLVELLAKNL